MLRRGEKRNPSSHKVVAIARAIARQLGQAPEPLVREALAAAGLRADAETADDTESEIAPPASPVPGGQQEFSCLLQNNAWNLVLKLEVWRVATPPGRWLQLRLDPLVRGSQAIQVCTMQWALGDQRWGPIPLSLGQAYVFPLGLGPSGPGPVPRPNGAWQRCEFTFQCLGPGIPEANNEMSQSVPLPPLDPAGEPGPHAKAEAPSLRHIS